MTRTTALLLASLLLAPCIARAATAGPAEPISAFAQQWLVAQYSLPGSRVEAVATPVDSSLGLAGCAGMMQASRK